MDFDVSLSRMANTSICNRNSQKPLTRYFPELIAALQKLRAATFVLDGEIVIPIDGNLSFDDLLMRIHPAKSRVQKLSLETPSVFIAFDLLVDEKASLVHLPFREGRKRLEAFGKNHLDEKGSVRLSPITTNVRVA
jgi:ATP-dependent DNA ligase